MSYIRHLNKTLLRHLVNLKLFFFFRYSDNQVINGPVLALSILPSIEDDLVSPLVYKIQHFDVRFIVLLLIVLLMGNSFHDIR